MGRRLLLGRGLAPLRVQVRSISRQGLTDEASRKQTGLDRQLVSNVDGVDGFTADPRPAAAIQL